MAPSSAKPAEIEDMTDNGTQPQEGADPQSGVLGNLPRTRPSVRSPRRAATPAEPSAAAAREESAEQREPEAAAPADLEALARSGLAIAGGAASLGLRIAGRAASAVRGAVERR
jgi:hypothetical protein